MGTLTATVMEESWHLRRLFRDMTRKDIALGVLGTYLQNPDRWKPLITVEPEYVLLELRERGSPLGREHRVPEKNVALRDISDIRELLNREMNGFLEQSGIHPNRSLTAAIKDEVDAAIEISGAQEDKAPTVLDRVAIELDQTGGRVVYVFLSANDEIHRIPITEHLHTLRERGPIPKEEFIDEVKSILDEYNLSKEDTEEAVRECVRLMRTERAIRR